MSGGVVTIVKRELAGYFVSPVAYVFLVIFLLLTGFFTFTVGNFFERGEASRRRERNESHLARIAEHRSGHCAAKIDVEPGPLPEVVAHRETGDAFADAAAQRAAGFQLREGVTGRRPCSRTNAGEQCCARECPQQARGDDDR